MKGIASYLPIIFIVLMAYPGYKLMKLKGYTGRRYLLLLFAFVPFFWIILGLVKPRTPHIIRRGWDYISILFGTIYLLVVFLGAFGNPERFANLVMIVMVTVFGLFGYYFLKLKGYVGGNYLVLFISSMPFFWIIFGLLRSNNERTDEKQLWSFVAICWGLAMLYINYQSVHIEGWSWAYITGRALFTPFYEPLTAFLTE